MPRRDDQVHPALVVLGRVVVPVGPVEAVRIDLARQRRDRVAVAEHAALDLDAGDELLDQHLLVVLERELDRVVQLLRREGLGDAHRRAQARRLDEHRVAEGVLDGIALPQRDVPGHGDAVVAHDRLEEVLVHAERGRGDARADVGNAGKLEQPLDGAVLAERAVEDGKARRPPRPAWPATDPVGTGSVSAAPPGGSSRCSPLPSCHWPVAVDLDRDRFVALGIEGLQHRAAEASEIVVLARAAAHHHGDADATVARAHGVTSSSARSWSSVVSASSASSRWSWARRGRRSRS